MKQRLIALWQMILPFLEPVFTGLLVGVVGAIFWLSVFGIDDGAECILLSGLFGALAGAVWNLWRMLRRGA